MVVSAVLGLLYERDQKFDAQHAETHLRKKIVAILCCDVRCRLYIRNMDCKYLTGELDYIDLRLTCDASSMSRCPELTKQSPWYVQKIYIRDHKIGIHHRFVINRLITFESENFKGILHILHRIYKLEIGSVYGVQDICPIAALFVAFNVFSVKALLC